MPVLREVPEGVWDEFKVWLDYQSRRMRELTAKLELLEGPDQDLKDSAGERGDEPESNALAQG